MRKRGIQESTIRILEWHGITSTKVLQTLEKDDIKELDICLGQRAALWKLVTDLQSSERDTQHSEHMSKETFWCLFKCFGGIGAAGLTGILALVAAVYALPAVGFTAAGVAAGSLAAKIMSLYGGAVAAGSWFALFQSLGAAGLSWKAILTALFGSGKVMAAYSGGCSYCFNEN